MRANEAFAGLCRRIARLLEFKGESVFKVRAYQRAAETIGSLADDLGALAERDELSGLPGIGKAIEEKVREFLETGRLEYLDRLLTEVPPGVLEVMEVPGMGPKKAARLFAELGVSDLASLRAAAEGGRVRELKGFGEKSEAEILKAIERKASIPDKVPYGTAWQTARAVAKGLLEVPGVEDVEFAGSLRRGKDYVGDVDVLALASAEVAPLAMEAMRSMEGVRDVLASGATKTSVVMDSGIQVDLRVLSHEHFGAAWMYFTGSKQHNVALRARAQKKGWTLNEYALTEVDGGAVVASQTEREIYDKLGLDWIPPELREDRGEIELAAKGSLPDLVVLQDLEADLHTHTEASDGNAPPEVMLARAVELGYSVYGISDHSAGLGIANGLDGARLAKQRKALDALRGDFPSLEILQGAEVDIRKSGELDLTSQVRSKLDYVVGSVHSAFTLDAEDQTRRVVKAVEGGIDILGHPTGRLLGERPSIEFDFGRVAEACAAQDVLLEIDSHPARLDLWGDMVRVAREAGCRFAIDSDAHRVEDLDGQRHGVVQARRGGLTRADVATALPPRALKKYLGHAKRR